MTLKTICLASSSQSRKKLFDEAHLNYEAISANIDEIYQDDSPEQFVLRLAQEKAEAVISKTRADVIVAADSVAVFDSQIFGKPGNEAHAIEILSQLQGQKHQFITGMYLLNPQTRTSTHNITKTEVFFSSLNQDQIQSYVSIFKPFSYAGGYSNAFSTWFMSRIQGSHSNLMGIPMVEFRHGLEKLGFQWFDFVKRF